MDYQVKRKSVFGLRSQGKSLAEIASEVGLSRSTVQYILKPKVKSIGYKIGRPKKINTKEKKVIREAIRRIKSKDERVSAQKILNSTKLKVCSRTIHGSLKKMGLKYKRQHQSILLSEQDKKNRVTICLNWIDIGTNFRKVIFSDEKKFKLDGPDNHYSWCNTNEKSTRTKRQCGGGGVMMFGAISADGCIYLEHIPGNLNSAKYKDILSNVSAKMDFVGNGFIFQQDNCSVHTSKSVKEFITEKDITTIKWPARSPDLNIMENVWQMLSQEVYDGSQYHNIRTLLLGIERSKQKLMSEKKKILINLYDTFINRIHAIIKNDGEML